MKFLYNLMRAFRIVTQELRYVEIYDLQGAWTEEDRTWLAGAMATPSGQKLRQRLLNMTIKAATAATQTDANNAVLNIGIARGVALAFNALQEHFISPRAQRGISEPSDATKS